MGEVPREVMNIVRARLYKDHRSGSILTPSLRDNNVPLSPEEQRQEVEKVGLLQTAMSRLALTATSELPGD